MAKVHHWAVHNGAIVPAEGIRLSPFQTGLLSGWGLFSTLRIYAGVPFALEDHLARLGSDALRLSIAAEEALAALPRAFAELIARNAADGSPGAPPHGFAAMARVYVIRNHGGLLDRPGGRSADWLIFTADLRDWGAAAKLRVVPHGRHAAAPLAAVKSLSWAANLALLEAAQREGFDDALLLNERGEVAECTSANIFAVRRGEMWTPSLASGALAGVSRKVILAGCVPAGVPAQEAPLRLEELLAAEEVFITSSTREVQPVSHLDDAALPPPGPGIARARQILQAAVERYTATHSVAPCAASRPA
ncbi:MAG: aminotransferase class IV [Terriglobales bacterium]